MRRGARKEGFVLVCVLWVLAILTVVTVGFGYRAMLDRRAAAYSLDHSQALLMARAAVQRGIVELRNKVFNDALSEDEESKGSTHLGQPWAQFKDLLGESKYFEYTENFEEDYVAYIIEDEDRRIDVNSADKPVLEAIEGLSRSAVRKIWTRRTKGVHDGEGRAPFQAIEELRYMRAVKDDDWFGKEHQPGLKYITTVYGDGRVNLNTASEGVLLSLPDMDAGVVRDIIHFRAGPDGELETGDDQGFGSYEQIADELRISDDTLNTIRKYCKVSSHFFKITGVATRRGGKIRAACSAVVAVNTNRATIINWQEEPLGS